MQIMAETTHQQKKPQQQQSSTTMPSSSSSSSSSSAAASRTSPAEIALLLQHLVDEDPQQRLHSVTHIGQVASFLGPERTRLELLPFLNDHTIRDDEDQVLMAVAESLGDFVEYVGGPQYANLLVSPLENLADVDDSNVREKAVDSLCKVAEVLSPQIAMDSLIPAVRRLAGKEWFLSRASAAGVMTAAYQKARSSALVELRNVFYQLCQDDTPFVRRAACGTLGGLIRHFDPDVVENEVMPVFVESAKDEQDSVRLLAVNSCIAIASILSKEQNSKLTVPVAIDCCRDRSWRVRYMAADRFESLCAAMGPEISRKDFLPAFVLLLNDTEAEVRNIATVHLTEIAKNFSTEEIICQILPIVQKLAEDTNQHVRAALACSITGLAKILGKDMTISHLVDTLLLLLKDDFPDVRLSVISKLDLVNDVVGMDLLTQSLLPAIIGLSEDRQWRIRKAIMEHIPALAKQLGRDYFDEKLCEICLTWLTDDVFAIREAATENLRRLTEAFGIEWARSKVYPKIADLVKHPNYLHRITTLFAIKVLVPTLVQSGADISKEILPIVTTLSSDCVANIRINVARTFRILCPYLNKNVIETVVKSCLEKLLEDDDRDVKFFAAQTLSFC